MTYYGVSSISEMECSLVENEKISYAAFSNIGFHFKDFRDKKITAAGNEMITRKYFSVNN